MRQREPVIGSFVLKIIIWIIIWQNLHVHLSVLFSFDDGDIEELKVGEIISYYWLLGIML